MTVPESAPPLEITDLEKRPDLLDAALGLGDTGGRFMNHGSGVKMASPSRFLRHWPRYFLIALADGVPVARAQSMPMAFPTAERPELPSGGYDEAIQWGAQDVLDDRAPTTLCALEIFIAPHLRGRGMSTTMLHAFRARAAETGLRSLLAPVRPFGKEAEPEVPMADYAARRRPDGLLADLWLRTHERLGARLIGICPHAVTVTGSIAEWLEWTGVQLQDGANLVPGGIAPVHASLVDDQAVYSEANVWMEHQL